MHYIWLLFELNWINLLRYIRLRYNFNVNLLIILDNKNKMLIYI